MLIQLRHSTGMGMTSHSYPFTDEGSDGHVTCPGLHSWRVAEGCVASVGRAPAYVPSKAEGQGRK